MNRSEIDQQVTFIYTHDLVTSVDFCGNILALEMVLDQGACQIFRVTGDSFLGVCSRTEMENQIHDDIIVTLVTDKVDEWYEYLQGKGVEIEHPPKRNIKYNIYHMFLKDPNGYVIEIQEFLDPGWPKQIIE